MRRGELLCATLLVAGCLAQTKAPSHEVTLLEGRGELITFPQDITKVAVSEPKIADAVVISPREIMINAKGPGRATLVIWETGAEPARYEVYVTKDNTEWDSFTKAINDSAGVPISVTGSGETIVLSGTVKSAADAKRLAGMAQTRAKTVINLLQSPPPPEPRQILLQVKFAAIDRVALTQVGFNLFSTNPKMIGASSTEQFAAPRFSQLQPAAGAGQTVNFSDLLNLFAFRPDLNIGATIKALQETQPAADSGRAEPDRGRRHGGHVPGRRQLPIPHHHHHAHRRRDGTRHHRAVQALRCEAGIHADRDAAGIDRSQSGAGSEQPRLCQRGHA